MFGVRIAFLTRLALIYVCPEDRSELSCHPSSLAKSVFWQSDLCPITLLSCMLETCLQLDRTWRCYEHKAFGPGTMRVCLQAGNARRADSESSLSGRVG
jgi:hypothetical protein